MSVMNQNLNEGQDQMAAPVPQTSEEAVRAGKLMSYVLDLILGCCGF